MTEMSMDAALTAFQSEDFYKCLAISSALPDTLSVHPLVLAIRGISAARVGEHEHAIECFERLSVLEPDDRAHAINLASSLRSLHRAQDAERVLSVSLVRHGASYDHHFVLAQCACDSGRLHEVLVHLQRIAEADHTAESFLLRGQTQYELGDEQAAQLSLNAALLKGLSTGSDANEAGTLANLLGDFTLADRLYRAALACVPPCEVAAANLAAQYERNNRLEEAQDVLRTHEGASLPEFVLVRARIAARTQRREEAAVLYHGLFELRHQSPMLMYNVAFEYGKVLDKLGRYDDAMAAFHRGHVIASEQVNRLYGGQIVDDEREDWDEPESGGPEFSWPPKNPVRRPLRAQPVFVIGFPRSGTTLMEQVLAAHPAMDSLDEVLAVERAIHELRQINCAYPASLAQLTEPLIARAEAAYWHEVDKHYTGPAGSRIVDKYPFNLVRLPMIYRLFPDAKVIMLIRHPLDCVLSCYMQKFKLNKGTFSWATLAGTARLYQRAMRAYLRHKDVLNANVLEIRYEDLVSDFDGTIRRALDYLDEPWDPAVTRYAQSAACRGRISTPSYAQVTQPIYSDAIGRWRHYSRHLEAITEQLELYVEHFNYTEA